MPAPATPTRWTADMVRALPDDGKRYEVIGGELFVTPAPSFRHQDAVLELALRLRTYLDRDRVGRVVIAPADVDFDEENMVEPDVFVTPLVAGRKPRTFQEVGELLLVVEVLSPGTARADRQRKRMLYQERGVPDYWIVDVDARLLERWLPDDDRPEIVAERLVWQPAGASTAFVLDLEEYFGAVDPSS